MKTAEEFVVIWQRAKTLAGVASATGASKKACSIRAAGYRKLGVPLKIFPRGVGAHGREPLNIPRMIALAHETGNGAILEEDRP